MGSVSSQCRAALTAAASSAGGLQSMPGDSASAVWLGKLNAVQNLYTAAGPLFQQKFAVPTVVVSMMMMTSIVVVGRQLLRSRRVGVQEPISEELLVGPE